MTSIPQNQGLQPQGQSTANQAASSPAFSDSSSPQPPSAPASSSYASATKKSATDSSAASVTVGGSAHHGKSTSVSSVSGNPMQQQPHPSGVTIVNGGPAPPSAANPGDHSRKPSVTITSAGTSGYMPNGGPASRPNSLQFGFANQQQTSPNMGNPAALANQPQPGLDVSAPANPRVTSPQASPAPIPQPASSGGRPPPSSYQTQGNVPNFGSFGDVGGDANMRPTPQAPLGHGPQATHLRRESSQSTHSDVSANHVGNAGPPRGGGYPHHGGGRGRGYSQSGYQGQMPFSSGPNFRSNPSQHRGGPNMGPQFPGHNQGRPLAPFPNSPHQANRSPALANAHPATPQMNQVPMAPPQMAPQPYGYGQHMGHQPAYPHAYDNNYGFYPPYGMPHMQYMTPPSPQPRPGMPQAPYMQNQYPVQHQQPPPPPPQTAPMSRNPSQVSNDRPGSSVGQPQPPSSAPTPGHAHSASRSSNSPAPPKPNFVIPSAKKSPIVIKDPGSGAVKSFEKSPASPARGSPSPAKVETPAQTPPPPQPATTSSDHARSESKSIKSNEEKKQELKDAVRLKLEQGEAEERRQSEEAGRQPEDGEPEARKTEEEDAAQKKAADEEAAARKGMEDLSLKEKAGEAKPATEEPKKEAQPAPSGGGDDDDIDYDAIERELAEVEAKEAAAEADYYAKKQAEKEDKERKEKEDREAYEANMQNAEREAEALEEARAKKREGGDEDKDLFTSLKKGFMAPGAESPAADSGTATPTSDTSMGPPPSKLAGASKQKPAALKLETSKAVEPPQPSAAMKSLHTARFVEDLSKVSYPPSVASPNPAVNANAPTDRKFHYNKDFLLQFQNVFKEKPSVDWDARVKETVGESDSSRPQSARTPMGSGGRTTSRPGLPFHMGTFVQPGTRPPGAMPDQRFPAANPSRPGMGNPLGQFGRPSMGMNTPQISRTSSSGPMHPMSPGTRTNSSRGTRTGSKRDKNAARKEEEAAKTMPLTAGKDVGPLQVSSTGWKPRSLVQATAGPTPGAAAHMPPDMVQRKVKAALNKMTPENFERIANQILEIVSQSKDESDGRTLRQVIQLTFEKATDEAHWAPIYAKFCKRMLESMSMEIKDENIRDKTGNVVAGGSLFRKYLLNRCQEEFERGWKVNLPPKPEGTTEEAAMMSDEYYAAAAAKRRGLGLVKFIGELYKLGMLTERIMHECVKKLVDYEGMPDEAEVESLTSLLRTIGASLDVSEKGHAMMDAYFARINMMVETVGLPSRLHFMLMDIIDLRAANWSSKDADKGPKTIYEIREQAAQSHQQAEMERMRQQAHRGSGRPGMGRGDARNFGGFGSQQPPPDYASSKVGSDDLRRLRTNRNTNQPPISFGPSSMLGSRSNSGRKNLGPGGNLVRGSDDSAASSRTGTPPAGKKEEKDASSSINAFSALAQLEDRDQVAGSPPSTHASPVLTKTQPAQPGQPGQPSQPGPERRPSKSGSTGGPEAS